MFHILQLHYQLVTKTSQLLSKHTKTYKSFTPSFVVKKKKIGRLGNLVFRFEPPNNGFSGGSIWILNQKPFNYDISNSFPAGKAHFLNKAVISWVSVIQTLNHLKILQTTLTVNIQKEIFKI